LKPLLILNENPPGAHSDIHNSLNVLKDVGILEDFYIYPFLSRLADGLKDKEVTQEIVNIAKDFQPSAVLWLHTGHLFVGEDDILKIKNLLSRPAIGYWDGDIYQKPQASPKEIISLCTKCDVVFVQGDGDFTNLLKKNGCKDIRYVPAPTDTNRFCKLRSLDQEIIYDVVMIGNNVTSRIPWRTAPGSRWRKELAEYFFKKLGKRFAVFGYGWKAKYGKGPLPFSEQVNLYHSSRMALGVNNWLGPRYYFSNRLPIALSSGVPVVHNYESGYEEIFKPIEDFFFFKTTAEAWNMTKQLLGKDQAVLDDIGRRGYRLALSNFTIDKIICYILEVLASYQRDRQDDSAPIAVSNPWINIGRLGTSKNTREDNKCLAFVGKTQSENAEWWERHPMAYEGWEGNMGSAIPFTEDDAEYYREIDTKFFNGARRFAHPFPGQTPFSELIDFPSLKGRRILEIGCGMGSHAELFARAGANVTAIDITETGVRRTAKRFAFSELEGSILRMDAEKLDFPDESFDFVWSWGVIHHSENPQAIARQIYRVLTPAGSAKIMVYNRNSLRYYIYGGFRVGILRGKLFHMSLSDVNQSFTDGAIAHHYTKRDIMTMFHRFGSIRVRIIPDTPEAYLPIIGKPLRRLIPYPMKKIDFWLLSRFGWFLFIEAQK